ncbi:MAG: hypothetical protein HOE48_15320 [Candidatus Latescibacteria bacterium]|jgi:hypothetical protein|nr:hypothetical protein [Candidatus Latescibacterota bacterium]MBT4139290.1 hypothetical protein [Candidatus Latescibacterota bacterium]
MNTLWALYVKEWKDARYVFAFLMLAIVGLEGYGWLYFEPDFAKVGLSAILSYVPFILGGAACFIAPPFLLARAFSSEWKSDTHYQLFSLPVAKFVPSLAKYLVALSNGLLMFFVAAAIMFSVGVEHGVKDGAPRVAYDDVWYVLVLGFTVYLILILGFVTAMEGVKFAVKRLRRLAAVGFWLVSMFAYFWFYGAVVNSLGFLGAVQIWSVMDGQMVMAVGNIAWASFLYPAIAGVLLLGVGLALFEKHVEI